MSRFVRFDLSAELATELLQRHQKGHLSDVDYRHQVLIGHFTKEALSAIRIPDRAVVTSVRLLIKVMEKHGLTPETVASLRRLILEPVAVYESATERDSIVVLTIEMPDGIHPVLVAIRVDVPDSTNKPNMHWMVSAYTKDDPETMQRWEAKGLLIWKRTPTLEDAHDLVAG